jgi:hypothetical protein
MTFDDPMLRRMERNALLWCLAAAGVALGISGGQLRPAIAVLAGGGLIGLSYWAITTSIDAFLAAADRHVSARRIWWAFAKFVGRYALLGLMAYVMIARLRMHPIGLLVGASSMVAAATVEAVRTHVRKPAP